MKNRIDEDSRVSLLNKSRHSDNYAEDNRQNGRNRFERRLKSKVSRSTKEYNQVDMNNLFENDILNFNVRVYGESKMYLVTLEIYGVINSLHKFLPKEATEEDLQYKVFDKAVKDAFNHNDVKVCCNCEDWKYRIAYFATKNNTNAGEQEFRPSNITNPKDTKGYCKHVNLVLNRLTWVIQIASVIRNYILYIKDKMPDKYQKYIYPKIFEQDYIEPTEENQEEELKFDVLNLDEEEPNKEKEEEEEIPNVETNIKEFDIDKPE